MLHCRAKTDKDHWPAGDTFRECTWVQERYTADVVLVACTASGIQAHLLHRRTECDVDFRATEEP